LAVRVGSEGCVSSRVRRLCQRGAPVVGVRFRIVAPKHDEVLRIRPKAKDSGALGASLDTLPATHAGFSRWSTSACRDQVASARARLDYASAWLRWSIRVSAISRMTKPPCQ
jgi:hypothetical protein